MEAEHQPEAAEIAEGFSLELTSLRSLRALVQPSYVLPGANR